MGSYIPKVSVIIPCYNGTKWVRDTIDSVLNQTYQEFELIIVDDDSTDNLEKIIENYSSDERIRYIQHKKNRGIPAARNTGIKASIGQYIAFLDQDDLWLKMKLEKQVEIFEQDKDRKIGLIFTNIVCIGSNGKRIKAKWPNKSVLKELSKKTGKEILIELFRENFIATSSVVVRKKECFKKLGLLNEDLYSGDDYEFWLRVAGNLKIKYVDESLTKKRMHKNNTLKKHMEEGKVYQDRIRILHQITNRYPFLNELKNKKLEWSHYLYGRYLFNNSQLIKARDEFFKALCFNCFNWKALGFWILTFFGKYGQSLIFELKILKDRMID